MDTASRRWIKSKSDEVAASQGCYFDEAAAERVCYFMRRFLRHSKGEWAGKPFEPLDWQRDRLIYPAYGWKRPNGLRRFRRVGCGIAKKQGKSTLLAALGLYHLIGDDEPGAEVYSCAASRQQASIIFNESAAMAKASKALADRLDIRYAGKRITWRNCTYEALSADVPTKEGLNISALLFDELHAQKTRKLWEALKYGGAARSQPLLWWISTAGVDRSSICFEQWERARRIQNSEEIDVEFLGVIYEADAEDDWSDPAAWRKANPSLGVTVSEESFAADCREAQSNPAAENAFRRYRLNQWTAQETRWIPVNRWQQCAAEYSEDSLRGEPCIGGLDLATTSDLNAFVMLFKNKESQYRVIPRFWLPEAALERRARENKARLDEWAHRGIIRITPGDVVDYSVIKRDICADRDHYKINSIAVDPWNATSLATELQGEGFDIQYVRQGFASISTATKEFEKLVLGKQISHNSNPVLDWMFGNLAVEQDASGNIKPSKRRSVEKIDGIAALINALAKYIAEAGHKPSVYEKRGIRHVR
jgi:phage terminase large subunit-like protein